MHQLATSSFRLNKCSYNSYTCAASSLLNNSFLCSHFIPLPSTHTHAQIRGFSQSTPEPRIRNDTSRHSSLWIHRHITDRYVRQAQSENYRSRAAYKLQQLDDRFTIFRKNKCVVDLGCYPGGWSQVALERCFVTGGRGVRTQEGGAISKVIGIDPLKIEELHNHVYIQEEVGSSSLLPKLHEALGATRRADILISDMSPRISGIKPDDHLRSAELCLKAADLGDEILGIGGTLVCKIFMGNEMANLRVFLESRFRKVSTFKPRASRKESSEIYFVCREFIGRPSIVSEVQVKNSFSSKEGRLIDESFFENQRNRKVS